MGGWRIWRPAGRGVLICAVTAKSEKRKAKSEIDPSPRTSVASIYTLTFMVSHSCAVTLDDGHPGTLVRMRYPVPVS